MKQNLEIEFKTSITKEKYEELLNSFNLTNNIFKQINHYFDNDNLELLNNNIVLRIREKNNLFKLTSKVHSDEGAVETHVLLNESEALNMLRDGFDASIINISKQVYKVSELTTERVSCPYKDGIIFFDKSTYYGKTDYEVEYEVNSIEQGKKEFNLFLNEYNIEYVPSISKSKRAYQEIIK